MSALARFRLLHSVPGAQRSYSSFFSSKAGSGRYFNSAKSKTPVVTAKSKSDSSDRPPKAASSVKASTTPANASSTPNSKPSPDATPIEPRDDTPPFTPCSKGFPPNPYTNYLSPHPIVNPKDFKMQQFFSLHRPLLLLSNPQSIFASAPEGAPLFRSSGQEAEDSLPASPFTGVSHDGMFTAAHPSVLDADAEAARQLHHAMTMSRVGPTVSWEATLQKLGLDLSKDADRVNLQEQWNREWEEVMLDSVKRKRKKKMKKHKLKKRKRATRAQRMRIGR